MRVAGERGLPGYIGTVHDMGMKNMFICQIQCFRSRQKGRPDLFLKTVPLFRSVWSIQSLGGLSLRLVAGKTLQMGRKSSD
jgi:hypothetical protein